MSKQKPSAATKNTKKIKFRYRCPRGEKAAGTKSPKCNPGKVPYKFKDAKECCRNK